MSDLDEIQRRPRLVASNDETAARPDMIPDAISITSSNGAVAARQSAQPPRASFTRQELNAILNVYGRKVASGEWRDYAIDLGREKATFSVFRRTSEMPLYRIEKQPKLARKQGAYSIVSQTGLVLKRGHDLERVLGAIDKRIRVVD